MLLRVLFHKDDQLQAVTCGLQAITHPSTQSKRSPSDRTNGLSRREATSLLIKKAFRKSHCNAMHVAMSLKLKQNL